MNTSMETVMHSDAVWKRPSGGATARRPLVSRWFAYAVLSMGVLGPASALAQATPAGKSDAPAGKAETPNAPSGKAENGGKSVQAATTDASAIPSGQGAAPWQKFGLNGAMRLEFHGSGAVDVGYDKYTFPDNTAVQPNTPDALYDLRGRFVLGADLEHDFGTNYFFHARGQFVAWVRETANTYQGNADDIYVQVGQKDLWDVQLGRFLTWRVFRKGLGFDLYTVEDQGPLNNSHWAESAPYAPHIYEVSTIFLRQQQGRAAFHLYPTPWSGLEVVGEYGRADVYNTIGGRAAGNITYGPLSVSLAGELKKSTLAVSVDGCPTCGIRNDSGFGGGAVLDFHVVELGANFARARLTAFINDMMTGIQDPTQSSTTNSFGGYLEVDPGTPLFQHRLILGGGYDRSEFLFQDQRFLRHTQMAGYIAYPLGFNDAMVKFVVSQSEFLIDTPVMDMPGSITENFNKLYSARLRASFRF
ncbi:MAG TPA: hypothetical protein VKT80_10190 [Chloroflexota bacterium]|nr:hypothetical protein [Chloroflexota bacterium]